MLIYLMSIRDYKHKIFLEGASNGPVFTMKFKLLI